MRNWMTTLPCPMPADGAAPATYAEARQRLHREQARDMTLAMTQVLTEAEQMRVSFIPVILTHVAWRFALRAMELSVSYRVGILKKLCRVLRKVHEKYLDELRHELPAGATEHILRQADGCLREIGHDVDVFYFSVNNEFKRVAPDYPYDDLRTWAIMSLLTVDMLEAYNRASDKLLARRMPGRELTPARLPRLTECLRDGMDAYAGLTEAFNRKERNIRNAVAAIRNRILGMEFTLTN